MAKSHPRRFFFKMLNFLKKLFGLGKTKISKGGCPSCGGQLTKAKSDIIETYGRPVKVCLKCKRLVEV